MDREHTIRGKATRSVSRFGITPGPLLYSRNSRPASKTSPGQNPHKDSAIRDFHSRCPITVLRAGRLRGQNSVSSKGVDQ